MTDTIVIVPFRPEDVLRVRDLILPIQRGEFGLEITYEDQPDLQAIPTRYQTGKGQFWTALDGEQLVGTIALEDVGDDILALRKVFVHADHRGGGGLSHRLLDTALGHARESGARWIYLGTTAKMTRAHRFYEKFGFEPVEMTNLPKAFTFPRVDTVFYRLAL